MNVVETMLIIGIYTGLLLTYIKISEIEAKIDFILNGFWQNKAEGEDKE